MFLCISAWASPAHPVLGVAGADDMWPITKGQVMVMSAMRSQTRAVFCSRMSGQLSEYAKLQAHCVVVCLTARA